MRFFTTVLLILFTTCLVAQNPGGQPTGAGQNIKTFGFIVTPAAVEFNLAPGQTITKKVNVANRIGVPRQFRLYLGDWERDSTGRHSYYPPGTLPVSCAKWTRIDKDFIELANEETVDINITMQVPDSTEITRGMKWAMLFIELINETKAVLDTANVTTQLDKIYRMGVHLLQTPPTLAAKEMKMISFEKILDTKDSIGYKVVCRNDGELQIRCKSALELTNLSDGKKTKVGPYEFPMFPGYVRNLYFLVPPGLPKGKYSVLVVVDAGEDIPMEAAQAELEIK